MAFTLPPVPLAADANAVGDLQLSTSAAGQESQSNVGAIPAEGPIVIESGNYYPILCDLYTDLDKYVGRTVTVTGFVFRDESFAVDQFVTARLLMVCCAADMQTVGLLCQYDGAPQLESDSWVTVTGVLQKVPFGGEDAPCIAVGSVEAVEAPEDAYIYPY
jgi:putative membrane protein